MPEEELPTTVSGPTTASMRSKSAPLDVDALEHQFLHVIGAGHRFVQRIDNADTPEHGFASSTSSNSARSARHWRDARR